MYSIHILYTIITIAEVLKLMISCILGLLKLNNNHFNFSFRDILKSKVT